MLKAAAKTELDRGSLIIYSHDVVIGREDFTLGAAHDTLVLHSECTIGSDGPPDEKVTKQVNYVARTPSWRQKSASSRRCSRTRWRNSTVRCSTSGRSTSS